MPDPLVREQLDSRRGSVDNKGRHTHTRRWFALGYENESLALDAVETELAGEDYLYPGRPSAVAFANRQIEPLSGHNDSWSVEVEYHDITFAPGDPSAETLTSGTVKAFPKPVFRIKGSGWDYAPSSAQAYPEEHIDIGGKAVDASGTPTSIVHHLREVTIRKTVDVEPPIYEFDALAGTRNNAIFRTAARGTVLYMGMTWDQTSEESWNIVHRFAVDTRFYHLEQVPHINDTDVADKILINERYHLKTVYWIQPFPLANFAMLKI